MILNRYVKLSNKIFIILFICLDYVLFVELLISIYANSIRVK